MTNQNFNSEDSNTSRRVPLIAALMSAVLPGFGQLYNGQLDRAIKIFLTFCLVALPITMAVALFIPVRLMVVILLLVTLLTIAVWIFGIVDAWKTARKHSSYFVKPWQTGSLYLSVFLICGLILLPLMTFYIRDHQVQAFNTPSGSMIPSVMPGDFIFTNKSYNCPYCRRSIERGDIAVFVFPNNRTRIYIKRIIGLPGDTVSSESGVINVNGIALSESALNEGTLSDEVISITENLDGRSWSVRTSSASEDFTTLVKPGHVFVLGDNRTKSNDSRVFGQIPMADVLGRAQQVWLSKGESGFRWSRFGKSLVPQNVAGS